MINAVDARGMTKQGRRLLAVAVLATVGLYSGAGLAAADPNKVLRVVMRSAETGLDAQRNSDLYSSELAEAIHESLYTYDYIARPARLVPQTAAAMPEISDGGKVWLIKLKQGIHFTPDPVFKGKPRELTAEDYIYTLKRLMDPKIRSPWQSMVEGKIVGLDEVLADAKKTNKFDFDRKVEGLQALDRHTLKITLKEPDYNFGYILAMPATAAVAREVIEGYEDSNAHPVGTGAYMLKEWRRGSKIVLVANPDFRNEVMNFVPGNDKDDQLVVDQNRGKTIPQIGRVEVSIIEESQARWLALQSGELDHLNVPDDIASKAFIGKKLAPDVAAKGIRWQQDIDPDLTYTAFNFRDPLVGGFSREKIALRRAIVMSYNTQEEIDVVRQGQAIAAVSPIPPGVVGYNPKHKPLISYNPVAANKLLDRFGYKKGPDGWRTLPDGKPLKLTITSETSQVYRQLDELWQKSLKAIGIQVQFDKGKFSDHFRAAKACQLQMWGQAWTADYPDGDNFISLLYGPNTGQNNNGCYESKAFDAMYEQARRLPPGPERDRLYRRMVRQSEVDTVWRLGVHRLRNELVQPWLLGFKKHPIILADYKYLDIDLERQKQGYGKK